MPGPKRPSEAPGPDPTSLFPDALTVYAEVDRRGGLLAEMADADECTTRFTVESADAGTVQTDLRRAIEERL
jgi:sporulation-control protein